MLPACLPTAVQVELTEEEAAAIDRLAAMGFDRNMCIEAFLICDKNEVGHRQARGEGC